MIFNTIFPLGYFPFHWKLGQTILILKLDKYRLETTAKMIKTAARREETGS